MRGYGAVLFASGLIAYLAEMGVKLDPYKVTFLSLMIAGVYVTLEELVRFAVKLQAEKKNRP